jgi:hypothetical protein
MVLKPQIEVESPAKKRDFTPIFIEIIEFNKRRRSNAAIAPEAD